MKKVAIAALSLIATAPAHAQETPPPDSKSWKLMWVASNAIVFFDSVSGPQTRRLIKVYQVFGAAGDAYQVQYRVNCDTRTMRRESTDEFDHNDRFVAATAEESYPPADPSSGPEAAIFEKACEPPPAAAVGYFGAENRAAARVMAAKQAIGAKPTEFRSYPTYPASPSKKAGVVPGKWAALGRGADLYFFANAQSLQVEGQTVTFDMMDAYNKPVSGGNYDLSVTRIRADCGTMMMEPIHEERWLKGVSLGRAPKDGYTHEAPENSVSAGAIHAVCGRRNVIALDLDDPEGWARFWFKVKGY